MYEYLQELDSLKLNFDQGGLLLLNITIGFIMFGVSLDIKLEHFKQVFKYPKSVLVGFFSQFLILPAVTFAILYILREHITPGVALGMILLASCPGGNISNFISSLAKANVALSVSLTGLATVSSIFLTPINFAFWGGLYAANSELLVPLEIDAYEMIKTVIMLLGIPIIAGLLLAWKLPKFTNKIKRPIKFLSIVIFMALVVVLFSKNFDYFINYILFIFILVLIHNGVALGTGFSLAKIFKLKEADTRTLTIETGIQNSGLGLVLLFNPKIFPPELELGGMAIILAWWGVWHILSGLGIAALWSRKKIKEI
jgi:bile acid:Na+ symporter, BASS family